MRPFKVAGLSSKAWVLLAFLNHSGAFAFEEPALPSITPLEGDWAQACSSRFQRTESITGYQVRLSENSFSDDLCAQERLSLISSGQITLGETVSTPPGAAKIDFTFEKVEISPKTSEVCRYFNQQAMCGFSDWEVAHPKDVTALKCDLFGNGHPVTIPSAGEKRFGIYQIQTASPDAGPFLYFGKLTPSENAKSEAARPTQLDPRHYQRTRQAL